jgi:hypothetical protein
MSVDQQDSTPAAAPGGAGSWVGTPRTADASDQKAVPDGPGVAGSRPRVLGPGSVAGTLVADPELRFTGNGKAITKVRLAVAERRRDEASGKYVDGPADFIEVAVWGQQGEHVMESLRKGDRVIVNGIWQEERWRGRDEEWHAKKTLTARDIGPSLLFRQATVNRYKGAV